MRKEMLREGISRRGLLKNAGKLAMGASAAAAVASGGLAFLSKAEAKGGPTEKWPWPYEKLDPGKTAEIAYNEWYRVLCGGAVISSVFGQLRDKIGEPYKSFPIDAFVFLEGGIAEWGTICGTNAGANIVSNLIIGPRIAISDDGELMGSEMMQWYSESALPVYTPRVPKITASIPRTISNSPLCHISVGRWMKAANKSLDSPERKDRCARVAASVAYHLVELMNAWKDGRYETKGTIPSKLYGITGQQNCTDCHGMKVPTPPMSVKG